MSSIRPISYTLLDEANEGQVRVQPRSRDIFFLTVGEAVVACTEFAKYKADFATQMGDLLDRLDAWVKSRANAIRSAHVTFRPDRSILFVVVQKDVAFDADLSEQLTELDIAVAEDAAFGLLKFDVLALPAVSHDSANAFLSSGKVYTHA